MTAVSLNKKTIWIAVVIALLILLLTAVALQPPIRVNGYAVSQEEYALWVANNPDVSAQQLLEQIVRAKCIQIFAIEQGLLTKSAADRLAKQTGSKPSFGPSALSQWDTYVYALAQLEVQIKDKIAQQTPQAVLLAYYEEQREHYRRANSVTAECIVWEDGRVVSSTEVSIDAQTVRTMSEANQPLAQALLTLTWGETAIVPMGNGGYYQLICTDLSVGGYDPFEEVVQAVGAQYAEESFAQLLTQRISQATITGKLSHTTPL